MTKIYLIRHAEADGNIYRRAHGHFDGAVTQNGFEQIKQLGKRFSREDISAVYSSDLLRARMTASALSGPRGLEIIKTPMLREVNIGEWEDAAWGDIEHRDPVMCARFGDDPAMWAVEGSERYADVQKRMKECICGIGARHGGETVAAVSHGFAIRAFLCGLSGVPSYETHKIPYCDNTAVALLVYDGGSLSVSFHGDNSHLHSEISTFAKQDWWRGKKEPVRENMRFEEAEPGRDAGFLRAHCGHVDLSGCEGRKYMIFLADEPVGLFGLDMAWDDAGMITCFVSARGDMRRNILVQMIGQAAACSRRHGKKRLLYEIDGDAATEELLTKHGFTNKGASGGKSVMEKKIS